MGVFAIDPKFFTEAADAVVELINSKPQSPTRDEIADAIHRTWWAQPIMEVKVTNQNRGPAGKIFAGPSTRKTS